VKIRQLTDQFEGLILEIKDVFDLRKLIDRIICGWLGVLQLVLVRMDRMSKSVILGVHRQYIYTLLISQSVSNYGQIVQRMMYKA